MPPLMPTKILGALVFSSKFLRLPVDWEQPEGDPDAPQYADALAPPERFGIPTQIPPWFFPHNMNKYHVASCNAIGGEFQKFHDTMIDAVVFAHTMWKLQANFKDLKINAVTAVGSTGCLAGPELESLIKNAPMCAAFTGNAKAYRDAVAKGVSKCFKDWQDKVTVPGLPWYPAFAAFPGPVAPPMPNVPTPLIACPSAKMSDITTPDTMKKEMVKALAKGVKKKDPDKHHEALFEAIATVLSMAFLAWLPMQMVMLVMGTGNIPSFAPPFVPVGPVVNGQNLPIPGHLAA